MRLFRLLHAGEPAIYAVLTRKIEFPPLTVKLSFAFSEERQKGPQMGAFAPAFANSFAICARLFQPDAMTQPLALVLYEKLLPGSQLVNRLQDLKYRVQAIADAGKLVECAEQAKPMLVLVDLEATKNDVCASIARLKQNEATKHLPIIGFSRDEAAELQAAARTAGVTLVVSETTLLTHLPQFLEQALQIE
jgi:PleD family two-component response regulator